MIVDGLYYVLIVYLGLVCNLSVFFLKDSKLPSTNKRELSSKDESDDQEEEDTIIIKKQRTNVSNYVLG